MSLRARLGIEPGHYAPTACKCGHAYVAHRFDFVSMCPHECQAPAREDTIQVVAVVGVCRCTAYAGAPAPSRAVGYRSAYGRCRDCGRLVSADNCPDHPGAERIAITNRMRVALHYLQHVHTEAMSDADMVRWVDTCSPSYWPGTDRATLALAWGYMRQWGGWLPELSPLRGTTPAGLYS